MRVRDTPVTPTKDLCPPLPSKGGGEVYSSCPVACATGEVEELRPASVTPWAMAPTAPLEKPAEESAAGAREGAVGSSPPCSSSGGLGGALSSSGSLMGAVVHSAAVALGLSTHTPTGQVALSARTAPGAAVARSSP